MAEEEPTVVRTEGQQLTGSLKVWNLEKGYGFMKCDDGGGDLFIHQSVITVEGAKYRAVAPDTALQCTYYVRDGKDSAKNVTAKDGAALPGFDTRLEATQIINAAAALPPTAAVPAGMLSGKVKFMNKDKGFGFISPDAGGEEMFVHVGDVQGQRILEKDEPVSYTTAIKKGDRPQAVQVVPLRAQAAPQPVYGYPQPEYPGYGVPGYPAPAYGAPAHGAPAYGAPAYGAPAQAAPQSGSMANGKVKWFNETKGFGFLIPSNGGTEVYFKGQDVVGGGATLEAEEAVQYENQTNSTGKVWAVNISRARGGKRKAEDGLHQGPYKQAQYAGQLQQYGAPAAAQQSAYGQYAPQPQYGAPPAGAYDPYGAPAYAQPAPAAAYGQAPPQYAPQPGQQPQYAPHASALQQYQQQQH